MFLQKTRDTAQVGVGVYVCMCGRVCVHTSSDSVFIGQSRICISGSTITFDKWSGVLESLQVKNTELNSFNLTNVKSNKKVQEFIIELNQYRRKWWQAKCFFGMSKGIERSDCGVTQVATSGRQSQLLNNASVMLLLLLIKLNMQSRWCIPRTGVKHHTYSDAVYDDKICFSISHTLLAFDRRHLINSHRLWLQSFWCAPRD